MYFLLSGGWKSEIRGPAWLCSEEDPLPGCRWLPSHCFLIGQKESQLSGLWKGPTHDGFAPIMQLPPQNSPLYIGRFQHINFRETCTFSLQHMVFQCLIFKELLCLPQLLQHFTFPMEVQKNSHFLHFLQHLLSVLFYSNHCNGYEVIFHCG